MKHLAWIYFAVFLFCGSLLQAQQEEQYTMFMLNKLDFNPAYAGVDAPLTINAMARSQWIGFEGAPSTQKINSDFTLSQERVGMGFSLYHTQIGISNKIRFTGNYAYRIQINEAYLGFGINASVKYQNINYRDKRLFSSTDISMDSSIPTEVESSFTPNFGVGFYYKSNKFYLGASLPNMLSIHQVKVGDQRIPIENHHYYLMTGYHLQPNNFLLITPQLLLKYVVGAPFDAEFNLMTTYDDKYKIGLGYRLGGNIIKGYGESFSIMTGLPITKVLFFGLSYDMTLSNLQTYNNGSLEAIIQYRISKNNASISINPRYL